MSDVKPLLETSLEINAEPAEVWALVSDLPRLATWSPQVIRSKVAGGGPVKLGSKLTNLNRYKFLVWPTHSKVRVYEPGESIAFEVIENRSIWSFHVEPSPMGTRVTHRREVPNGLTKLSSVLTRRLLGGQQHFTGVLEEGMSQTLARVKAEAER